MMDIVPATTQRHIRREVYVIEHDGPLRVAGDILGVGRLRSRPQRLPRRDLGILTRRRPMKHREEIAS